MRKTIGNMIDDNPKEDLVESPNDMEAIQDLHINVIDYYYIKDTIDKETAVKDNLRNKIIDSMNKMDTKSLDFKEPSIDGILRANVSVSVSKDTYDQDVLMAIIKNNHLEDQLIKTIEVVDMDELERVMYKVEESKKQTNYKDMFAPAVIHGKQSTRLTVTKK